MHASHPGTRSQAPLKGGAGTLVLLPSGDAGEEDCRGEPL